jgi:hypothetical protein
MKPKIFPADRTVAIAIPRSQANRQVNYHKFLSDIRHCRAEDRNGAAAEALLVKYALKYALITARRREAHAYPPPRAAVPKDRAQRDRSAIRAYVRLRDIV